MLVNVPLTVILIFILLFIVFVLFITECIPMIIRFSSGFRPLTTGLDKSKKEADLKGD